MSVADTLGCYCLCVRQDNEYGRHLGVLLPVISIFSI